MNNPLLSPNSERHDVIIIGAGGAGMMCAIHAAKRSRDTLLLDHSKKVGGKILISGGGRCNFTNRGAGPGQYVSQNPHFCKSALSRYPSDSFVQMVEKHGIPYHEKKLGQLFCDHSAQAIVNLLQSECADAGARFRLGSQIQGISQELLQTRQPGENGKNRTSRFRIRTEDSLLECESLVIATGGLSIPKIGATGLGYQIAKQFGLNTVTTAPALDGFTFTSEQKTLFAELSGISVDCMITCNGVQFRENLLFTHSGLSGPAALQASLHWGGTNPGSEVSPPKSIEINLLPEIYSFQWFMTRKKEGSRATVKNLLAEILPRRLADRLCELYFQTQVQLPLPQVSERTLEAFCQQLHQWILIPSGTVGYNKAEVTRGGVDTNELSSKTMESKKIPGLYFIGEVVDVTGWLGGYNFQWAWASGWAAGQVV